MFFFASSYICLSLLSSYGLFNENEQEAKKKPSAQIHFLSFLITVWPLNTMKMYIGKKKLQEINSLVR